MQPELSNNQSPLLQIETPKLVVDPEGTRCRENAVCLSKGTLHVYICVPPEKFLKLPEYKLYEFIQRTFSLSSIVPLRAKNAELVTSAAINKDTECLCLDIAFSLADPFDFKISLKKISEFKLYNSEDFYHSEHFNNLLNALNVLEQKLDPYYVDKLSPKRRSGLNSLTHSPTVNDFEKKFGLLHNHAYHLVHLHLKANQIAHLHMSTKDDFKTLSFGIGDSSHKITKIALGSPLKKIAGFINILQTAYYLLQKDRLFTDGRLSDLADNINELKLEASSAERKEVIRRSVAIMERGILSSQPAEFQNRIYLLIDHLAHSAPFPDDAWKLLLYEATPAAAKKQIIQHAANNPAYAVLLLYELNKSAKICEKNYKIKEEIDFDKKLIRFKLFVKNKREGSNERSVFEFTGPLKDFDQTIHHLRLEVIQKLARYSVRLDQHKAAIPFQIVSSARTDELNDYIDKHIDQRLSEVGYTLLVKDIEHRGLSFFQLEFVHSSGFSYTYETAPNNRSLKENNSQAVAEMLNFIAKKMSEFGLFISRPENDFDSDLPDQIKECGLDTNLLKFSIKKKPTGADLYLEYKLRLMGNDDNKLKKTVSLKFDFRQDLEAFKSLYPAGSKEYSEAIDEYLRDKINYLIKAETDKFLTEVAKKLGYFD